MNISEATMRYVRVAPRKARLLADLIRGLAAGEAEAELMLSPKRAAGHLLKLLRSAAANAKQGKMNVEALYVKEIRVDGGPMLKRWRARARGSAGRIEKKTSHIKIVLGEMEKAPRRKFSIIKKEKESKEKHLESPKGKPKEKAEREIEKKNSDAKTGKRKFFQRKSV